jgi:hypothetical protein
MRGAPIDMFTIHCANPLPSIPVLPPALTAWRSCRWHPPPPTPPKHTTMHHACPSPQSIMLAWPQTRHEPSQTAKQNTSDKRGCTNKQHIQVHCHTRAATPGQERKAIISPLAFVLAHLLAIPTAKTLTRSISPHQYNRTEPFTRTQTQPQPLPSPPLHVQHILHQHSFGGGVIC